MLILFDTNFNRFNENNAHVIKFRPNFEGLIPNMTTACTINLFTGVICTMLFDLDKQIEPSLIFYMLIQGQLKQ
jgi:hypothetical protein